MIDQSSFGFGELYEFLIELPYGSGLKQLTVVTGFSSAAVVRQLLFDYPDLRLRLLIGMARWSGISDVDHHAYCDLAKRYPDRFDGQYYIGQPGVHAKLYVWGRRNNPELGIVTSANLSWSGLQNCQEAGIYTDPAPLADVYSNLRSKAVSVLSNDVPRYIRIFEASSASVIRLRSSHGAAQPFIAGVMVRVTLSLLTGNGEIHTKSGLNWGQREGRNPNQAYIPIPAVVHQAHPGFFPPRKQRFIIKTDDGELLTCVVAQEGDKAIETPDDNSSLGSYFRRRLGVASGEFVTLADLERYGRTSIDLIKIDDDLFLMDFSSP